MSARASVASRVAAHGPAIPDHLRERQSKASDPACSIWVSANAGSGKTHVLTQRVIRLLLGGVAPSRILCLTFTKAAAAQMATRVFDTLSGWTALADGELRAAILATGAPPPDATDLVLARRLFTRTVETPGGLKIQTIHAFCERLLHLFPFEANVPARFTVTDDLRAGEMLGLARRGAIEAAQRSTGAAGMALALVADLAGPAGIEGLIAQAIARRAAARRAGSDVQPTLRRRLGGGDEASPTEVRRAMVRDGIAPARWPDLAAAFAAAGGASDAAQADRLRAAAAALARNDDAIACAAYRAVFFGADKARERLLTKAVATANPGLKEELHAEQGRLARLDDELRIAEAVERTDALLVLADATLERYRQAKIAGGLLDFDDLIERTLALLRRSDAGWVLHKLDAGIDHVLVDEAQDTSEAQWQILERLTGDFASGAGAGARRRSFFVVGDDKQSIFSFQGAAPLMFDRMRLAFERRFRAGAVPFERVMLKTSFRSVPGILGAVDTVFERAAHQDGLVRAPDVWPVHESIKTLPGLVEVWPRVKAEAEPDPADWAIPLDVAGERDPASTVADRIALRIKAMLAHDSADHVHDKTGARRPVRPGDVLILVRTRNSFFEAMIRALKRHYVPVAGADRLDVANHIAVMDLVAAGRTALLPADDLSLACVLKSPLFGLDDDDLIALAPGRAGTLMAALAASSAPRHRAARETLQLWGERAAATTPFAFYIELLGRDGGRRRMEARLGAEAHDAIDEFLRLALNHEGLGAPSLGAFLAEVEALDTTVKRDMEGPGAFVRVMTVHAAKGLEAKVVFLPDTCGVPAPRLDPVVFDLNKDTGEPPLLVWSPLKKEDPPAVAAARAAERQAAMGEYRRLLYVALTRAEERLYIAGFNGAREPPPECWNAMVAVSLGEHGEEVPAHWAEADSVRRIATPGTGAPAPRAAMEPAAQARFDWGPEWLFKPLPTRMVAPVLRPSRIGGLPGAGEGTAERRRALAYGSALHELLQHLPPLAPAARAGAGRAFLQARAHTFPVALHDAVLAEALGVIDAPALADLFAGTARAEVTVSGRLDAPGGGTREVDGTVDRLVVTAEAVIVADFKTGQPPAEIPRAYRDQVALYRRVLVPLWPGRAMRTLLVWTRGPVVVELDPADLDAAAAAVLAAP